MQNPDVEKTNDRFFPDTGINSLAGEVHVYRFNLAEWDDDLFQWGLTLLDSEEQNRAARFRHQEAQRRFVMVRSCLRVLLGRYLLHAPWTIRFTLGEKGKPRLTGTEPNQGLVFNVTHSGDRGLIALAMDTALGIDVERRRAMANLDGMAQRCFAPSELTYWRTLPESCRLQAFFAFWSCKEAFVKATGEGITLGLESCVVDLSLKPRLVAIPGSCGMPHEWQLVEIDAGPEHGAGLCYRGADRGLRLFDASSFVSTSLNMRDLF